MTDLLKMLHDERASLSKKIAGIDAAIAALNGTNASVQKRTMSAAVRAKISRASQARWAKVKR